MPADVFTATAVTTHVEPGSEQEDGGKLTVRDRIFTDVVRSDDARISGTNRLTLNLDIDLESMDGRVHGTLVLEPERGEGEWRGEVLGEVIKGLVTAQGLAGGQGNLSGALLRIDFQQVEELDVEPEHDDPLALYRLKGMIASSG